MTKKYSVELSPRAIKELSKIDPFTKKIILAWIRERLEDCENPRAYGKGLSGDLSGLWRYRIGDSRVIARIIDEQVLILVLDVGHRRKIYKR